MKEKILHALAIIVARLIYAAIGAMLGFLCGMLVWRVVIRCTGFVRDPLPIIAPSMGVMALLAGLLGDRFLGWLWSNEDPQKKFWDTF